MFRRLNNKSKMYTKKNKYYIARNLKKENINNSFTNKINQE